MKNKTTAMIFALLLGGIGVHRFYLWNYFIGFLYLLFCLTFIPLIISLIEAVYFLCISKQEFDIKYNAQYLRDRDYIQGK